MADPGLAWWGLESQRRIQVVEVFSGSVPSTGAPLGAAQSGSAAEAGKPLSLWQAAHCNSLTKRVPRSIEGGWTPVWIPAEAWNTAENRAAATVNGAETRCRKQLMGFQRPYAEVPEAAKTVAQGSREFFSLSRRSQISDGLSHGLSLSWPSGSGTNPGAGFLPECLSDSLSFRSRPDFRLP